MKLIVGDIGGTNTRLAMAEVADDYVTLGKLNLTGSQKKDDLRQALQQILTNHTGIKAICLALAGPVIDGNCHLPNLDWAVRQADIQEWSGMSNIYLINDLEAIAHGLDALSEEQRLVINQGQADKDGNLVVIAAGTGLGEAAVISTRYGRDVVATEGGHADFSPDTEWDWRFRQWMSGEYGHVSWDRVVSGNGLESIYQFILDVPTDKKEAAEISRLAMDGDPKAVSALDAFIRFYGMEAGNLVLKYKATAGVYLAGGIAPRIYTHGFGDKFMSAFTDKGRMRALMQQIPVTLVTDEYVGLKGAALYAQRSAS